MKNIKFVKAALFTLILAFMAIGTVAIAKEVMKKEKSVNEEHAEIKTVSTEWFYFTSPIDPAHPDYEDALLDENNYTPTNNNQEPEDCEPGTDKVCAVRAQPSTSEPSKPDPTDLINLLPEMTSNNPDPDLVILKEFDPE